MSPQKLKTKTGCVACRKRRKKCDEIKPECQACRRLKLSCSYAIGSAPQSSESQISSDHIISSESSTQQRDRTLNPRTADHVAVRPHGSATTVLEILSDTRTNYQGVPYSPNPYNTVEEILIEGVCRGWQRALDKVLQDSDLSVNQWRRLRELDAYLVDLGHGQVARMIFLRHYQFISEVRNESM